MRPGQAFNSYRWRQFQYLAPAGIVDLLRGVDVGAAASLVRLLPAGDPLLHPRDRAVLVSDRIAQKALWPTLGRARGRAGRRWASRDLAYPGSVDGR